MSSAAFSRSRVLTFDAAGSFPFGQSRRRVGVLSLRIGAATRRHLSEARADRALEEELVWDGDGPRSPVVHLGWTVRRVAVCLPDQSERERDDRPREGWLAPRNRMQSRRCRCYRPSGETSGIAFSPDGKLLCLLGRRDRLRGDRNELRPGVPAAVGQFMRCPRRSRATVVVRPSVWSPDGTEIFYRLEGRHRSVVDVTMSSGAFSIRGASDVPDLGRTVPTPSRVRRYSTTFTAMARGSWFPPQGRSNGTRGERSVSTSSSTGSRS